MDNDTLINQARRLYAQLHAKQCARTWLDKKQAERLERLVEWAYCRYMRRLNRCAICYKTRPRDCKREYLDIGERFCSNCLHGLSKDKPDSEY
ncbi:MAG: hypothetical protein ACXWF8_09605 [Methylobacter sp.]